MSGILKEFQEFIIKGNAFDLAVGVIIGAAFSTIVNSLVSDILMPPIGFLMGGIDFSNYFIDLTALAAQAMGEDVKAPASLAAAREMGHAVIAYGSFLNALINLLIVGLAIFLLVKQVNALRRKPEEQHPPAKQPDDVRLLTEIRDILAGSRSTASDQGS